MFLLPSNMIGKWFDVSLGKEFQTTFRVISSQAIDNRNLSSLDLEDDSFDLEHMNLAPVKGKTIKEWLSINFENSFIALDITLHPALSSRNQILLKTLPDINRISHTHITFDNSSQIATFDPSLSGPCTPKNPLHAFPTSSEFCS